METKVVTAHLPTSLVKQVDKLAEQMERPRGWVVKQALTEWIEREGERYRLIIEGLEDVDADRLIDHEDVVAWAESLSTDHPLEMPE